MVISLTAFYIGRFFICPEKKDKEYSKSTDNVLSILGSGYGVFLGFVIITLWNHYLNVQKIVYHEADALSVVVRDLEVLPPSATVPLKSSLVNYLHSVRNDEWEKMKKGERSEKTWNNAYKLYRSFQEYTPHSTKENLYYRQIMNYLDGLLKDRRDRLIASKSILNDELRVALILGAVMIIFLSSLLKANEGSIRIFANFCLATVIGFNLTLALSFDFPFSGSISVNNAPFYQGVLSKL
ncbi:DUF4239 domain-containing protein [Legionella nautarum]|nr:DUF4239 domain-containing protein [Legionella nautarum]